MKQKLLDIIFNEVCLDNRISDGIFKMDEEQHMDALRDYFVNQGLTVESAITVTNRMVEGKYPERQAYNKDGILVTFPTPQHKHRAIARGSHFEKNPNPQKPPTETDKNAPKVAPPGSKPEPGEVPNSKDAGKDEPIDADDIEDDEETDKKEPNIFQGDRGLSIEPPKGSEKTNPPPPQAPTQPSIPRTPERIAAEKEVVKQIMATDDTTLSNITNALCINEDVLKVQLRELYKYADKTGLREAVTFLTRYVES
jgi:hypothetical protein